MTNKLKFGQIKPNLGIPINWGNPLAKGLVGYWPMLEGTGNTVQDLSGNGNDGNLVADTHWVGGKFGPCLSFDGDEDYVLLPYQNIGTTVTYAFWYKDPIATSAVPLAYMGSYAKFYAGGGMRWFPDQGETFTYITWAPPSGWAHFVLTQTGTNVTVYINGAYANSANTTYSINTENLKNQIGGSGTDWVNGTIDDVMIYNRALSASEVAELYRNPFGLFERDDTALWQSGGGGTPITNQTIPRSSIRNIQMSMI